MILQRSCQLTDYVVTVACFLPSRMYLPRQGPCVARGYQLGELAGAGRYRRASFQRLLCHIIPPLNRDLAIILKSK